MNSWQLGSGARGRGIQEKERRGTAFGEKPGIVLTLSRLFC